MFIAQRVEFQKWAEMHIDDHDHAEEMHEETRPRSAQICTYRNVCKHMFNAVEKSKVLREESQKTHKGALQ